MQVTLNTLPGSLAEFQALPQAQLRTPEDVCAAFLCALHLYLKNQNDGVAAMNVLRGPRPMTPYDSQFLRDRQGVSAAGVLCRGYTRKQLCSRRALCAERAARPPAPGHRARLYPGAHQHPRRGLPPAHQAAAEALHRPVVPVGVFQPPQRHPYTGGPGSLGVRI